MPEHNDPQKLADEFNDYYIDKIKKLRETIPTDSVGMEIPSSIFEGLKMERFDPVDEEELEKIIGNNLFDFVKSNRIT